MSPSEPVASGTPIICHLSDALKVLVNIYLVREKHYQLSYISFFLIPSNNMSVVPLSFSLSCPQSNLHSLKNGVYSKICWNEREHKLNISQYFPCSSPVKQVSWPCWHQFPSLSPLLNYLSYCLSLSLLLIFHSYFLPPNSLSIFFFLVVVVKVIYFCLASISNALHRGPLLFLTVPETIRMKMTMLWVNDQQTEDSIASTTQS